MYKYKVMNTETGTVRTIECDNIRQLIFLMKSYEISID